jgi:hypothetical protein
MMFKRTRTGILFGERQLCTSSWSPKAGAHEPLEARGTVIWEKRDKDWLIVHEHFSAPAPKTPSTTQKILWDILTQPRRRDRLFVLKAMTANLHSVRSSDAQWMCCCTPSASGTLSSGNRDL